MIIPLKPFEIKFIFSPNLCHLIGNGHVCCVIASCVCACVCASHQGTFPFLSTSLGLISKSPFYTFPLSLWLLHAPWTLTTLTNTALFQKTFAGNGLIGPSRQTCATLMKWEMTAALCGAVGLLSTMSWIHWETLLKRVMKRSRMGLSTVQPCITKLW